MKRHLILKVLMQPSNDQLPSPSSSQYNPVETDLLCRRFGEFIFTLRQILREELSSQHTFTLEEVEIHAEISPAGEFHLMGGGTHGGVRCVLRRRSFSESGVNPVVFDYGP